MVFPFYGRQNVPQVSSRVMQAEATVAGIPESLADKLFHALGRLKCSSVTDLLNHPYNIGNGDFCNGEIADHGKYQLLHTGEVLGAVFLIEACLMRKAVPKSSRRGRSSPPPTTKACRSTSRNPFFHALAGRV